jgi:hypothetical protein
MTDNRCYLQWYRDKGRGQEASDQFCATHIVDYWPIAQLTFDSLDELRKVWAILLHDFGVNATTYFPSGYTGPYV